jgi:hypothetical protein
VIGYTRTDITDSAGASFRIRIAMTTIDDWFTWATADAKRRGLSSLKPLLESLRAAMRELRAADWNEDATDLHAGAQSDRHLHAGAPSDRRHGNERPTS